MIFITFDLPRLMKTKSISYFILLVSVILIFSSCEKKDESSPEIGLLSPISGDTISMTTDSVRIEFHVKDNDEIHMTNVDVTQAGVNIFSNCGDIDAPMYHFSQDFKPQNINAITPLELLITASDHAGNQSSKKATFYVKP
jgi:hypothetical protein